MQFHKNQKQDRSYHYPHAFSPFSVVLEAVARVINQDKEIKGI